MAQASVPVADGRTMTAEARRNQRNAVLAGFLGWTLDAFDYFVLTFVIADIARSFGRTTPDIALTLTLALATRPLGAVIFGIVADRYGRRLPLMINVISYAVISVLSGLAPSYHVFVALRMLFGIAMGGEWGVGASLALESASPRLRGLLSGLLQEGYAIGNLTDWVTYRRSLFQHWPRFAYLVLLMTMMSFISHGTQDMYPTLLRSIHFSGAQIADITILSGIGAVIGGLVFGYYSDRAGRRRAMVSAVICCLLVLPMWVSGQNTAVLLIGVFLMQFFVQGAWGVVPAHINELSPGQLRGFMPGLSYQLGILFAASIPYVESVLGERFTYTQAMGGLMAAVFILGAIVIFLGPEAHQISFRKAGHPEGERDPRDRKLVEPALPRPSLQPDF